MTKEEELAIYEQAALWETVCGECKGLGIYEFLNDQTQERDEDECPDCNGTRKVPVLPSLQEPCPVQVVYQDKYEGAPNPDDNHAGCHRCKGRRWIVKADPMVLEQELRKAGYVYGPEHPRLSDDGRVRSYVWKKEYPSSRYSESDLTLAEVLLLATKQLMEKESAK